MVIRSAQRDMRRRTGALTAASRAELLVHEPRDLGAVGAAFGLTHDVADDRADRLGVAFTYARGGVGVGLQCRRDDAGELVLAADRGEPLGLDDRVGLSPLGDEPVEDLAAG